MKTIFATNLIEIENLIWYDGPLLTHYRDGQQDYIMLWNDVNWISPEEHESFYLVFQVTKDNMISYLDNNISLLDLLKHSVAIYECVERAIPDQLAERKSRWESWLNDGEAGGRLITFDRIPQDSLPTEKSYLRLKNN